MPDPERAGRVVERVPDDACDPQATAVHRGQLERLPQVRRLSLWPDYDPPRRAARSPAHLSDPDRLVGVAEPAHDLARLSDAVDRIVRGSRVRMKSHRIE